MVKLVYKYLFNTFFNNEVSMYLIRVFKINRIIFFIGSN